MFMFGAIVMLCIGHYPAAAILACFYFVFE